MCSPKGKVVVWGPGGLEVEIWFPFDFGVRITTNPNHHFTFRWSGKMSKNIPAKWWFHGESSHDTSRIKISTKRQIQVKCQISFFSPSITSTPPSKLPSVDLIQPTVNNYKHLPKASASSIPNPLGGHFSTNPSNGNPSNSGDPTSEVEDDSAWGIKLCMPWLLAESLGEIQILLRFDHKVWYHKLANWPLSNLGFPVNHIKWPIELDLFLGHERYCG